MSTKKKPLPKLSKENARLLAEHNSWREFGQQFGWTIFGTNGQFWAIFYDSSGGEIRVTEIQRRDIERRLAK